MTSCDTFVVLGSATITGGNIFGKNSDRPCDEVQEVIYYPPKTYEAPLPKLKCTYIEVDQCAHTYGVILSKPCWMWGVEMGSNEKGLCVGNEAVFTKLQSNADLEEKLLGMDLVRLALERAATAEQAIDVIAHHLEVYGQGGPCAFGDKSWSYHNSFLIVDHCEAWVLETAGACWVAEKVKTHFRNISNCLSIGTDFDKHSANLHAIAKDNNLWDSDKGTLNFAKCFSSSSGDSRYRGGQRLLKEFCSERKFSVENMISILRDRESGICMTDGAFISAGSQVSLLKPDKVVTSDWPLGDIHLFTGAPKPNMTSFKPFIFIRNKDSNELLPELTTGNLTVSYFTLKHDQLRKYPEFQASEIDVADFGHPLYVAHQELENPKSSNEECLKNIMELERHTLESLQKLTLESTESLQSYADIFKHVTELEINFIRMSSIS